GGCDPKSSGVRCSMSDDGGRQVCFVDMPFRTKVDPRSGTEIDFDDIYECGIRPGIETTGLTAIRGDKERTGGIIHTAMFARLLLSEFVVADLTTANPNVFYELGVRHSARPYTTIPIFATVSGLPCDTGLVRAIPYDLEDGRLTEASASKLQSDLAGRIHGALEGPTTDDSPLFQLFHDFPGVELSDDIADTLKDRVEYAELF